MRTLNFIIISITFSTAAFFIPSAIAHQSSPLVMFLVEKACQGQPAPYKSGCNGYLHKRISQKKSAQQSFDEAENLCSQWYSTDPVKKTKCIQGVEFINSKE